ncbi:hypothetical protein [Sphingomonas koreensis]|nr:hypothetical protein [Sphingomonas koreensis]
MTSTHKPPLLGGAALRAVPAGAFSMKPIDNLTIRIDGKRPYKVEGASLIGTRFF